MHRLWQQVASCNKVPVSRFQKKKKRENVDLTKRYEIVLTSQTLSWGPFVFKSVRRLLPVPNIKGMLHETTFLATCNATMSTARYRGNVTRLQFYVRKQESDLQPTR